MREFLEILLIILNILISDSEMLGLQVDGGTATPPNEPEPFHGTDFDYGTEFISQVDGADEGDQDLNASDSVNQTSGRIVFNALVKD